MRYLILILLVGCTGTKPFVPTEFNEMNWQNAYSGEVVIDRSIEEVWSYVSDSNKSKEWSIYFHHIKPIPSDFADGTPGAVRRCYRNQNEEGAFWDEKTLSVSPLNYRLILSYNFSGYMYKSDTYSTYVLQEYTHLGQGKTLLKFKTRATEQMTFIDRFIFFFSRNQVEEIFNKNLINIKNHIEGRESIYPYTNVSYTFFEK